MSTYFWDTSALVKRYFEESGSKQANTLFSDQASIHHASGLIRVETISAIVRRASTDDVKLKIVEFDADADLQLHLSIFDDTTR